MRAIIPVGFFLNLRQAITMGEPDCVVELMGMRTFFSQM